MNDTPTPTPRTDAMAESVWVRNDKFGLAVNFARELERENARLRERVAELWNALSVADRNLDDIDTAGDAFKPEQTPYFEYVARKCLEGRAVWRMALSAPQIHP